MKSIKYQHGKYNFTSYWKNAGNGWEVGFTYGKEVIFVGNFIHQSEATQWYRIMNREIKNFSKKYTVGSKFPFAWYCNFITNHLYKCYYGYLERCFSKYNRDYRRAVTTDLGKYRTLSKRWTNNECLPFFKKVA